MSPGPGPDSQPQKGADETAGGKADAKDSLELRARRSLAAAGPGRSDLICFCLISVSAPASVMCLWPLPSLEQKSGDLSLS